MSLNEPKIDHYNYITLYLMVQLKVTVECKEDNGRMIPLRVHTIVISIQHSPDVSMEQMRAELQEKVIKVFLLLSLYPEALVHNQHVDHSILVH